MKQKRYCLKFLKINLLKGFQALADIESSKNNSNMVKEYLAKAANADEGFNYFCSSCGNKNLNGNYIALTVIASAL